MNILWEKDGCGLFTDNGTLWLFVRDGAGMHSTSLTDETRRILRALLMAHPRDFDSNETLLEILVRHGKAGHT